MIEGDITLLLAGVLAHSYFFGEYSFARVLFGDLGGFLSDNIAYAAGRGFRKGVSDLRFYRRNSPRMERLTTKFGLARSFFPSTSTVCAGQLVFFTASDACLTFVS